MRRVTYILESVRYHEVLGDVFRKDVGEKELIDESIPLHLHHLLLDFRPVQEFQAQVALYLRKLETYVTNPGI